MGFISYSEKDSWIAKQIANLIEEKKYGIKAFLYEKDIEGGESISELIRKNIQECRKFVVLLSRYFIDRPWILIEIGAAWVLGKCIIAIIDKVTPEVLSAGEDCESKLKGELSRCDIFVMLLSSNSISSG